MKYSFIDNAHRGYLLSAALVFLSIGVFIYQYSISGSFLRYGIDFLGGTRMEIQGIGINQASVQSALSSFSELSPQVTSTGNEKVMIKTKALHNDDYISFKNTLEQSFPGYTEILMSTIGPTIGESLKSKAIIAITIALIAIIVYIAFAFQESKHHFSSWKFGLSAVITLFHDVFITVGLFTLVGIVGSAEIDALFVTAILTLIGFSVHDTIVTFDRVRENSRRSKASDTLASIADASIHQTIRRSINTSFSTLIPLFVLYVSGIEAIRYFVLALMIGIVIGTYSSIFLATPLLVRLHDNA